MLLVALLLSPASPAQGATGKTSILSSALAAEIAHEGPSAVVAKLNHGSGAAWKTVLTSIASGQSAWLEIARVLHPGLDAGTAEDVTYALAKALQKNPAGVLAMTGTDFAIKDICQVPLIEPTPAQFNLWKHNSLIALTQVRDASLSRKVLQCRESFSAAN